MAFWQKEKFEYIRQPHILALTVLIVIAVCAALMSGYFRFRDILRRQTSETTQACMELINDEALCRFAAANEVASTQSQIITTTTTNSDTTEVSTIEIESPTRLKSVTLLGLHEVEAYVVIDATTYVKDYEDGIWATYTDETFSQEIQGTAVKYDFTSPRSEDVIEFRDRYRFEAMEPCDNLTCYKYGIQDPDSGNITTYVWFDNENYMLRRYMSIKDDYTTNMQFTYQAVTIEAPSPTKPITAEDLEEYL